MLAYYVEWHMRQALAPLLFQDEKLDEHRRQRDPVKPAQPSEFIKRKKTVRLTSDGLEIQSFKTLLAELATRCRNKCRLKHDHTAPAFYQVTEPTHLQKRAFELLGLFPVK